MPYKDPEKKKQYDKEFMRKKRLRDRIDRELNKLKPKPEPVDLVKSIAEANRENPLGFDLKDVKEFGKDLGKQLSQSFFEDKPNQATNLNCLEVQRHIKEYLEAGNREHFIEIVNHCGNCNNCAKFLASERKGFGGIKLLW